MFGDLHLNRPFIPRKDSRHCFAASGSIFRFVVRILPQSSFPWGSWGSTQARSEMTHRWLPLALGQGRSGPKPAWVPKPHQPSWKRKRRVFRSKVGFSCNNSFKPVQRQIQSQIGPEIWKQSVLGDMSIVSWACRAMKLPREVAKFGVGSLADLVPAAKKKEGWREGERIRHESHFNQDLSGGCSTSDCGRRWSQVLSCNAEKRMKTYFSNRILWNIIGFELTLAIQNIRKTGVEPARTRVMSKWLVFVWDCTQLFEWYHTSWESRPQPVSVFALQQVDFASALPIGPSRSPQTQLSRLIGILGCVSGAPSCGFLGVLGNLVELVARFAVRSTADLVVRNSRFIKIHFRKVSSLVYNVVRVISWFVNPIHYGCKLQVS